MSDIWSDEQARRLYPLIGLAAPPRHRRGRSRPGLVGSIGVAHLLIVVSAVLLGLAMACVLVLGRWARERARTAIAGSTKRRSAAACSTAQQVFATPFMRSMAILMLLGDAIGTIAYMLVTDYSGATFTTRFLAHAPRRRCRPRHQPGPGGGAPRSRALAAGAPRRRAPVLAVRRGQHPRPASAWRWRPDPYAIAFGPLSLSAAPVHFVLSGLPEGAVMLVPHLFAEVYGWTCRRETLFTPAPGAACAMGQERGGWAGLARGRRFSALTVNGRLVRGRRQRRRSAGSAWRRWPPGLLHWWLARKLNARAPARCTDWRIMPCARRASSALPDRPRPSMSFRECPVVHGAAFAGRGRAGCACSASPTQASRTRGACSRVDNGRIVDPMVRSKVTASPA